MAAIERVDGVRGSSGNSRADVWKMAQALMEQEAEADKASKAGDKKKADDLMADKDDNGIPDVIDALPLTDEEKQQLMDMMGMNGAQTPKGEANGGGGGGCGGGGGGTPQGAGSGSGSGKAQGTGSGSGSQSAGGSPEANRVSDADAKVTVGGAKGEASVDVNGDGKDDVHIAGNDAQDMAKVIKDMADKNPEAKKRFMDQAADSSTGKFEIKIGDLGGRVAGQAPLGSKGRISVDDQWKGRGVPEAIDTVEHEILHTEGSKDGKDHDIESARRAQKSGA
jgi:hypothetical protein